MNYVWNEGLRKNAYYCLENKQWVFCGFEYSRPCVSEVSPNVNISLFWGMILTKTARTAGMWHLGNSPRSWIMHNYFYVSDWTKGGILLWLRTLVLYLLRPFYGKINIFFTFNIPSWIPINLYKTKLFSELCLKWRPLERYLLLSGEWVICFLWLWILLFTQWLTFHLIENLPFLGHDFDLRDS